MLREQRNHSHLHRAFHSQREQTGLTALDGCSMQWSQKVGAGEKMVGNEREVSRGAVTGFRCCLYAEVLLLSGEPCGFISCSLAELILAMLKLAVWAGKLTLQAVLCPWPGEAVLLPAALAIPKLVHVYCWFSELCFTSLLWSYSAALWPAFVLHFESFLGAIGLRSHGGSTGN